MKRKVSWKKLNNSMIVAVIAVVINIITVSVYIYQARIMQSQQNASVWPYLEWRGVYNQDDGYTLRVKNNGIGPALIKKATFYVGQQTMNHPDSLLVNLLGTDRFPHLTGNVENRVLPAGESILMISIKDPRLSELFFMYQNQDKFSFEICYESIYEDAWVTSGKEVRESRCK